MIHVLFNKNTLCVSRTVLDYDGDKTSMASLTGTWMLTLTLILLMWRTGWAPNRILIYIQQDATLNSLFISANCSTCFGWYFHPSSRAHTPVSTASGICHTVTATCRYRGKVGTGLSVLWVAYTTYSTQIGSNWKRQITVTVWQIPDIVDTVVCALDDGWKYHPKHVEQFPGINKLCKVASCWIFIGIYLWCTDP
jgi:hypothetical protein